MKKFIHFINESKFNFDDIRNVTKLHDINAPNTIIKYNNAIDMLEKSYENGSIYNTDYNSIKNIVNIVFERIDEKLRFLEYADGIYKSPEGPNSKEIGPMFSGIIGSKKSYEHWKKYETKYPKLVKLHETGMKLQNILKEMKDKIVKGKKPNENIDPNKFIKPMAPLEAKKKAMEFLKKAVESFEKSYRESVTKSYMNSYEKIKDIKEKKDLSKLGSLEQMIANLIFIVKKDQIELKQNSLALVNNIINETVTNIIDGFIAKNTEKLAHIFAKKLKIDKFEILRTSIKASSLENELFFKFDDNTSFIIETQVVYKYSQYNKLFVQYPTRFRNVKMKDGSTMKTPSEEKMIKEF